MIAKMLLISFFFLNTYVFCQKQQQLNIKGVIRIDIAGDMETENWKDSEIKKWKIENWKTENETLDKVMVSVTKYCRQPNSFTFNKKSAVNEDQVSHLISSLKSYLKKYCNKKGRKVVNQTVIKELEEKDKWLPFTWDEEECYLYSIENYYIDIKSRRPSNKKISQCKWKNIWINQDESKKWFWKICEVAKKQYSIAYSEKAPQKCFYLKNPILAHPNLYCNSIDLETLFNDYCRREEEQISNERDSFFSFWTFSKTYRDSLFPIRLEISKIKTLFSKYPTEKIKGQMFVLQNKDNQKIKLRRTFLQIFQSNSFHEYITTISIVDKINVPKTDIPKSVNSFINHITLN